MADLLILYYSRYGATKQMAEQISRGVEMVAGANAIIRTVPPVSTTCEATEDTIPKEGHPYVTVDEVRAADGLILGSPTRFGNMAAPLKYFIDSLSSLWLSGALVGKPAGVFTSTSSMHGGQETTLISMMLPLIHLGMMIVGAPYSIPELASTMSGGTPYGPSHTAGVESKNPLSDDEIKIAQGFGKHVAEIVVKLQN